MSLSFSKEIEKVLDLVQQKTNPISIFLYGSRARKDFLEKSDYEIGILYKRSKKWSRNDLTSLHNLKNLRVFPFAYEDFIKNNPDTPFPKAIYMRSLASDAVSIYGKEVVENMDLPEIRLIDLFEEAIFQIARAYSATLSFRQNDFIGASEGFSKSALFGTRVYLVLKKKVFPLTYDEIYKSSRELNLIEEYRQVIKSALLVRKGKKVELPTLYKNISFLNQFVSANIRRELEKGNRVILPSKSKVE